MICWYCHWGWSEPVAKIYKLALEKLHGGEMALHYGPSHIVWEDENWFDDNIQFCLKECDNYDDYKDRYSKEEIDIVRWSLEELLKLPIEVRDPCPEDYDEEHPEKYPPINGIKMIRV